MRLITGAEPKITAASKHNANYTELEQRIAELEAIVAELRGGAKPAAKKAVKAEPKSDESAE